MTSLPSEWQILLQIQPGEPVIQPPMTFPFPCEEPEIPLEDKSEDEIIPGFKRGIRYLFEVAEGDTVHCLSSVWEMIQ